MGVLNVTPDSFSDGGRYADLDAAVGHGVRLRAEGADLVDVGGESTRPGADRVDAETEATRVLPVIRELAAAGVPVSIDTSRAASPRRRWPPGRSWSTTSPAGSPTRTWRGSSGTRAALGAHALARALPSDGGAGPLRRRGRRRPGRAAARVDDGAGAGVAADRIVVDPGLGFAKTRGAQLGAQRPPAGAARPRVSRCCSGRAASRTWAAAGRPRRRAATDRRAGGGHRRHQPCSRWRPAPGAYGCTTSAPPWTPRGLAGDRPAALPAARGTARPGGAR